MHTDDGITPPPVLNCARVLFYAVVNENVQFTRRTLLFVDGKELGQVPRLAICEEKKTGGVLLFHCDREWTVLGCSDHPSADDAKAYAERNYVGISRCWVDANVSIQVAEAYLDELLADECCSFCGLRPDLVEHMFGNDKVSICSGCIDELHKALHSDSVS